MSIWNLIIRGDNFSEQEKAVIKKYYESKERAEFEREVYKRKIVPFAAKTLSSLCIDKDYWMPVINQYRKRNIAILAALDCAYGALHEFKVEKIFVSENFAALLASGSDIGLFASGDIDNYADISEREKIYKAFESIGYIRKERFAGNRQIAAEFYPKTNNSDLPDGFYISVDFYPLARLKLPCFINADNFVDWSSLYFYNNTHITLPPNNALAYICMLHISLHSFSRAPDIRLYFDLLNISKTDVDYNKLLEWAQSDNTYTRLGTAVSISNKLMNTDFSEQLFNQTKRCHRVKKLVFNENKNDLIYEPKGLKVLLIEIRCDDKNDLHGLSMILFPDRAWMQSVYGANGFIAHIKHFLNVL